MHKCVLLVGLFVLVSVPAAAQVPRTPWGDPDLQGTWDFTTITPLQRPPELAGKAFLTESEAAALEKQINQQRVQTEEVSPGSLGGVPRPETDPGIYNLSWWWEPNGRRLVGSRRTSLVIDPPDGRIPPLTTDAQAISRARDAARELRRAPNDLPLAERCIMGFNSGPPMVPGPYNNLVQIVQSPGSVVIVNEMVHDARIVPLDTRPHLGEAFQFWAGDSRGRWEGDTLVVETRNLTRHGTGTFGLPGLTDRNARVVERFTRTGDRGLIGTNGLVVGLDQSADVLHEARRRAGNDARIVFTQGDVTSWRDAEPFDVIVGRLLLFHVADPVAVVRHHVAALRPAGQFIAIDFDIGSARTEPAVPLLKEALEWISAAFSAAGASPNIGARLGVILEDAGLTGVTTFGVQGYIPPRSPAGPALVAGVVRSLEDAIVAHGIATREQVGIETLESRLADALSRANAVLLPPTVAGAWGRRPAS